MTQAPTGTLTFLFTDIEGSTRLWVSNPEAMKLALVRHDDLLRDVIAAHGGRVFKLMGDSVYAVFAAPPDAIRAAAAAQRALQAEPWEGLDGLRVRIAVRTGRADERDGDYYGAELGRSARLVAAGHGGQVLVCQASESMSRNALPRDLVLCDLGEHRLRDFAGSEHIFQLAGPELRDDFPPLRSLDEVPNNLPVPLTTFVGREREIAALQGQCEGARLVTLTGPGGIGKTRLALEVVRGMLDLYADGVWFADLSRLSEPDLVPVVVASALGLSLERDRSAHVTVRDHVRGREMLLVLDNCEQALDGCAAHASDLLWHAPGLHIVATSREPLGVQGEVVWTVPPLSHPRSDADGSCERDRDELERDESVRLFVERATLVQPTFRLLPGNATTVARICRQLEGLPLAIELAAARTKLMPLDQLADRLQDRLNSLGRAHRGALPRHQTLRATLDWSHDLLAAEEQTLFRRVGVFAGRWSHSAAQAVCSAPPLCQSAALAILARLVDKSLVTLGDDPETGPYSMLGTVRQYALEKLRAAGEDEATRDRHLDHYAAMADEARTALKGENQASWLETLESEHDNMRAALAWSIQRGDAGAGLRLTCGIARFWDVRGYWDEGQNWLSQVLAQCGEGAPVAGMMDALTWLGFLRWAQGDYAGAREAYEATLALGRKVGDEVSIAASLGNLGNVASATGDDAAAEALFDESLATLRRVGDRWRMAMALNNRGEFARERGDTATARLCYGEALDIMRDLGEKQGVATLLVNLAQTAYADGDYEDAERMCRESLELWRELGDKQGIAVTQCTLGKVRQLRGDREGARSLHDHSLRLFAELGDRTHVAECLGGCLVLLASEAGEDRTVALLSGAAKAQYGALGTPSRPPHDDAVCRAVAAARDALGCEDFESLVQEGSHLSASEAAELVLGRP